jgi:hypothetical protein
LTAKTKTTITTTTSTIDELKEEKGSLFFERKLEASGSQSRAHQQALLQLFLKLFDVKLSAVEDTPKLKVAKQENTIYRIYSYVWQEILLMRARYKR